MESDLITEKHVEDFITNGFVVVPNVYSSDEVQNIRDSLHNTMRRLGFDYDNMNSEQFSDMPRFGCQTEIFYPDFKFSIHEDPKFFNIVSKLFESTFAAGISGFESPFSGFNPKQGYMYIDRVNCRLPDSIKVQGGLGLHVDCDPLHPHEDPAKWRPIQASVVLTDCLTSTSGGLLVIPGMHTSIKEYVLLNHSQQSERKIKCKQFTPLNKCLDLTSQQIPVYAPAGSVVLWDNRLPHATSDQHDGPDTREVLFMTYLPAIPRNYQYACAQRKNYLNRKPPPDFTSKSNLQIEQEEPTYQFSELGLKLMAFQPWPDDEYDDFGS